MPDPAPTPPQRIGIAVVLHDDCVLVGTRGPEGPLAGYAEFPGGKCELGESPADCAVRECLEETGLAVVAGDTMCITPWSYPHGDVELHFVNCRLVSPIACNSPLAGSFRWTRVAELQSLRFPEANAALLTIIAKSVRPT
jgi:8-oxo-dGTP diphosphatase